MTVAPMQPVPLTKGKDGTIRITGSRVSLDVIVAQFKQGATAEQIQTDFPSLSLTDIYAALSYYLRNQQEADSYLHEREEAAAGIAAEWKSDPKAKAIREQVRVQRAVR